MATTQTEDALRLSPAVAGLLNSLRRRIRGYVWIEGAASAVAWLGAAFWLTLAADWFFEPSRAVRAGLLGAAGLVLAFLLYHLVVRRAFVRFTDANMAMVLERRFPGLDESLLTAVEVAARREKARLFSPDMLAHTCHEAESRVAPLRLREVFNPGPLRRSAAAAVLLVASVGAWAASYPAAFGIWTDRMLGFSDQLWPRRTVLSVVGFDGPVKVGRGADREVIARVDLEKSQFVPQAVYVRGRTEDGARIRATMDRVGGDAEPAGRQFQEYVYKFQGLLSDVRFDLHGGDAWVEGLEIDVVDNPTIARMELNYEYPKYMGLSPRTAEVTGIMPVPQGTKVTVRATANKDLERVEVVSALEDNAAPAGIAVSGPAGDRKRFDHLIPSLEQDTALLFTLFDADGIKGRDPVRLALAAVPDEAPQLEVRLRGIGQAVTPQARIPALGRVADDHGIARTWWEYEIQDARPEKPVPAEGAPAPAQEKPKPREVAIEKMEGNPLERPLDVAVEANELNVQPGQKLALSLKAADRCDRGQGPNVGSSDRWLLDVVTPEQLRTMLESRELVLRQRFEVIIREVEDTRELLVRMEFSGSPEAGGSDNSKGPENKPDGAAAVAKPKPAGAAGPGDEPEEAAQARTPEQIRTRALMAAQRASQNAVKNRHEVLGVADAFDEIREELINNRIDSEKLRRRLKEGIADPLRHVAGESFPRLEQRLHELEANVAESVEGPRNRLLAVQLTDALLVELRAVLRQMIELETFNEAVAALRAIIESQGKLNDETRQRHKDKLRDLLEK